jgi:hypothetical protein
MNRIQIVNIAGYTRINWDSGATATLIPKETEIEIHYETPTNGNKKYILSETSGKKMVDGELIDKKGMIMR